MAQYSYTLGFYAFSHWNAAANTTNTVEYTNGTSLTLSSTATVTQIFVTDDDGIPTGGTGNTFDDGFVDVPGNGSPSSTANNDQLLTAPVTVNGVTFPAGSQVELEFAFTTTSGDTFWVIRINGQNVGISGPTLPVPGTTYVVNGNADSVQAPIETVPCFAEGTRIATPGGERPVEALQVGDLVMTADHGAQPVRWIGAALLSAETLRVQSNLRPIRISAGALGEGFPMRDLIVSPQHRILLRSKIAMRMFSVAEVLVPAKKLLELDGVSIAEDIPEVWYYHFMCDAHEIVTADGALAETLYMGREAAKGLGEAALAEISAIFGSRLFSDQTFARPVPAGKAMKNLVARHLKNQKAVFQPVI